MSLKISQGSGATLATNILNGEHLQIISPVSIYPLPAGTNFIGLASVAGNVNINNLISLASGTEVRSLATINNFPATYPVTDNGGSLTVDWISGATVAVSNIPNVTIGSAIPAGTNFIGLVSAASIHGSVNVTNSSIPVTQSGTWNAGITGLVSLPSGTEIKATATINNWPTTQAVTQSGTWNVGVNGLLSLASGTMVGLNPSSNHIGSVSIFGNVNTTVGAVTLNPGPAQIGSVTISNIPAVTQSGAWSVGVTGLISLASGTEVKSLATINNWPATQAVTQSGTWNVGVTGLISLASGTFVSLNAGTNHIGSVSIFGSVTANTGMTTLFGGPNQIGSVTVSNNVNMVPLFNVTLNPSSAHIGSVSIFGSISTTAGMTTLFPGPNQIGSVTISNIVAVTQSGTWDEVGINDSGNSITVDGTVAATQSGTWTLGSNSGTDIGDVTLTAGTNYVGLASVNIGGTLPALSAGTNNIGDVDVLSIAAGDNNIGNVDIASIAAGANYIGLASVNIGGSLPAGTNNIGDVDILTIAAGDNNIGNVDIVTLPATPAGTNFIGLATVVNGNQPALVASSAYIGLASVNIGGTLPALTAGANFIGLVSVQGNVNIQSGATVNPLIISTYTSFATIYSASGNATLFVPPASNRWILKDLLISSQGAQVVSVKSGTQEIFPPIALASLGGFVLNNGDSGLRAKAVNEAFVLNLGATATLSVLANVRFDV